MSEADAEATISRLMAEGPITLAQAARLLPPTRGKRRHTSSLLRWVLRGKNGVRLEAFRGPGKSWFTSREAIGRFFARLTEMEGETRGR